MLAEYLDAEYYEYESSDGLHGKSEFVSYETSYEAAYEGKHE